MRSADVLCTIESFRHSSTVPSTWACPSRRGAAACRRRRGATPGPCARSGCSGRRRVRRVGRIHTTINTKSIDHCTGVAWLKLSLRECAPRPRTRRLPGGGAAWALPTSEKANRCRRQLSSTSSSPSWPVFSASFGVECVRGISWLITPSTRPRSSSPSTSVIRMY